MSSLWLVIALPSGRVLIRMALFYKLLGVCGWALAVASAISKSTPHHCHVVNAEDLSAALICWTLLTICLGVVGSTTHYSQALEVLIQTSLTDCLIVVINVCLHVMHVLPDPQTCWSYVSLAQLVGVSFMVSLSYHASRQHCRQDMAASA